MTQVVIVGGGFAGLQCAIELAPYKDIRITLLDRNNYQQFQPLLYQVATSILSPSNAAFALRDILRDHSNVDVHIYALCKTILEPVFGQIKALIQPVPLGSSAPSPGP